VSDAAELARIASFMPAAWRRRVAACGGVVHEAGGLAVCLTGVPLAPFNPTLIERLPTDPDAAIEQAKADWREDRFAAVPGETERIPLPGD